MAKRKPRVNPKALTSIEEAAEALLELLNSEQRQVLATISEEDLLAETHFLLGMFVRNRFKLWDDDCPLIDHTTPCRMSDPDHVSVLIVNRALELSRGDSDAV